MISAMDTSEGLNSIIAFSSAKLTLAEEIPLSLFNPFSMRVAQAAHVIPVISSSAFCLTTP